MNFKVDTSNFLGLSNARYKNDLLKLALTKPEDYFKLRATVLEAITENQVKTMFNTFYFVMTSGKVGTNANGDGGGGANAGAGIKGGGADGNADVFVPNMAYQEVSDFALDASKTIQSICEDCVEKLLPLNYRDLAESRMARKGDAKLNGAALP